MQGLDILCLDIKIIICSADQNAWINLALADPCFRRYAWSDPGRVMFVDLFTVKYEADHRTEWRLFDRR